MLLYSICMMIKKTYQSDHHHKCQLYFFCGMVVMIEIVKFQGLRTLTYHNFSVFSCRVMYLFCLVVVEVVVIVVVCGFIFTTSFTITTTTTTTTTAITSMKKTKTTYCSRKYKSTKGHFVS